MKTNSKSVLKSTKKRHVTSGLADSEYGSSTNSQLNDHNANSGSDVQTDGSKRKITFEDETDSNEVDSHSDFDTDSALSGREGTDHDVLDDAGVDQDMEQEYLPDHGTESDWREHHCSDSDCLVKSVKYACIDIYKDQITSIKRGTGPSGTTLTPLVHEY
jgi:hypothetical protein